MRQPRKTCITTIRMTPYQEEKIRKIAQDRHTDISDIIRYALDLFLDEFLILRRGNRKDHG